MMSVVCFSFITLCLVACSFSNKKSSESIVSLESDWVMPLSSEQMEELNEYFKALTVTHFGNYEKGDDCSLQLLNFSSQLIQLDYPAMVEPMWRDEEAYVSFDKKMIMALIEQYFNEEIEITGIYSDLGDYIVRPEIAFKSESVYPEFHQCQLNEDGTYTIDFNLYELDEEKTDEIRLSKNWSQSVNCKQVGVASATIQHDEDESYVLSYHPIYFDE